MRMSTRGRLADPTGAHRAILHHAQQFRLQRQRQLADLIKEKRAAIGGANELSLIKISDNDEQSTEIKDPSLRVDKLWR